MRRVAGRAIMGVVRDNPLRRAKKGYREGGRKMPVYVTLLNWTDQGIRNVREAVQRVDSGVQVAEQKYGVRLREIYWTVGPYDYVGLWEAPDEQSMSAFMLELGSLGNVRSTTLRAYDHDEMGGILERLG
jgi:uncharacterized protein with GYD domain